MDNATGDPSLALGTDPVLTRTRQARQEHVVSAADAAGQSLSELLVHGRGLKQRGTAATEGDPFMGAWCDALVELHRTLMNYDDRGGAWPHDGRQIAWNRIELNHGADIAALVLALLGRLRDDLERCERFARERAA